MDIRVSPDELEAIQEMAVQNGTTPEEQARALLADAVRRAADYEHWFREQVTHGLAAADRSELIEHEEVVRMFETRFRVHA